MLKALKVLANLFSNLIEPTNYVLPWSAGFPALAW